MTRSGATAAMTSSKATTAQTPSLAAPATTGSPTPTGTTCSRAGRATTRSTPVPDWTSSCPETATTSPTAVSTATSTFAGEGNDLVIAGDGPDTVFGGGGDDWQEGGNANDLLQGDSGAPFFDDINNPGHDVLIGDSGEDDYDAEGGDDIMVAGPGIERNHGVYGFDWVTHARSVEAADSDMRMVIVEGPNALKDRFLLVEALSGWDKNDVLRGDDVAPSDPDNEVGVAGLSNALDAEGIKRITGLADLLPAGATEFGAGNIIIGGGGQRPDLGQRCG